MEYDTLSRIARATAKSFNLPEDIVCAICEQESNWNPWAIRFEEGFYKRYTEPMKLSDTEEHARAMSFGVMQVMGQTARERGFQGKFLTELCDPVTGIEFGCKTLAHKLERQGGDIKAAILAYNGGARLAYLPEVLAKAEKYR